MLLSTWPLLLLSTLLTYKVEGCALTQESLDFFDPSSVIPDSQVIRRRREVTLNDREQCAPGDEQPPIRVDTRERVDKLIAEMNTRGLDAYIVPSEDEHQSEYVADADRRRGFISGFTGSAGTAVILASGQRALWTDGRYFLEAEHQLDCDWLLMKSKLDGVPTMLEWLKENLSEGQKVGLDPALVAAVAFQEYEESLIESGIDLVPEFQNLVDIVWTDAPVRINDPVYVLENQFSGKSWPEKVKEVREAMKEKNVDLLVVTALDEIAWLLNLRGNDIQHNTVFRSYVIMDYEKVTLFINKDRITPNVDFHLHISTCLDGICFEVSGYENLVPRLRTLSEKASVSKVLLPKKYAYSGGVSYAVLSSVPEEKRLLEVSPILLMKARKNEVEFNGMKNAHIKDAVALIDFLALLEEEVEAGEDWDEIKASERLEQFRAEQDNFVTPSFQTISAYGSNGAVIHYRPTPETNKKITTDNLYLLDSGGQYKDGTTDVTRTLHFGTPTEFQIDSYTRVLMGAIDLAMLVFPKGTGDVSVDVLARRYLYEVGLDYLHGTGHGIGMFLNIHESPTQVRIYGKESHEFELGQFFSDEPGYYKNGEFGIRLETIIAVVPTETQYEPIKDMYAFEAITLVPFEPKLINMDLLNGDQCKYLNNYHAKVRNVIGPVLESQGRMKGLQYLRQRTEPYQCPASGLTSGSHSSSSVLPSESTYTTDGSSMIRPEKFNVFSIILAFVLLRFL